MNKRRRKKAFVKESMGDLTRGAVDITGLVHSMTQSPGFAERAKEQSRYMDRFMSAIAGIAKSGAEN
ncbi:MAG: hypothetical protein EOO38_00915 [Cytophagaceae bacterium]|nr:MAG: hypothetical protein EOO38_00915 [Cytophagaceae bacterium]